MISINGDSREAIYENIKKEFPIFDDCKLINFNLYDNKEFLLFSKTGEIGLYKSEIAGYKYKLKIINIKEILSIKYNSKDYQCIFTINNFENPQIIINIYASEIETAKNIYNEIKSYYSLLKKQIK